MLPKRDCVSRLQKKERTDAVSRKEEDHHAASRKTPPILYTRKGISITASYPEKGFRYCELLHYSPAEKE